MFLVPLPTALIPCTRLEGVLSPSGLVALFPIAFIHVTVRIGQHPMAIGLSLVSISLKLRTVGIDQFTFTKFIKFEISLKMDKPQFDFSMYSRKVRVHFES